MSLIVATDIGGTCTDTVLVSGGREVFIGKSLSTPPDFARGVSDSIASAAGSMSLNVDELLSQTRLFRLAMEGLTVTNNRDKWITHHEKIISALLTGEIGHAVCNARESMKDIWDAILGLPDSAFGK